MRKCIKADDLLGRCYEIHTKQGRRFLFKADRLFGETQSILRGQTEEQERKIIRVSQIAYVKREGVEYEVLDLKAGYGLDEWKRDAAKRDAEFGTSIMQTVLDRIENKE